MAKKKNTGMPTYDEIYDMLITEGNPNDEALKTYLESDKLKYAYGTLYNNYIQQPGEVFAKNNINAAKAKSAGASNPFAAALNVIGGAAMSYGMKNIGSQGILDKGVPLAEGTDSAYNYSIEDFLDPNQTQMAALGTNSSGTPKGKAEVEGGEAFEMPNGKVGVFEGASHEQGGVDVNLPQGVEIYSKRLKKNGVSHAEIAKKYQRKISKLEKRYEKNPTDNIVKNTIKREKMKWEQESEDLIARQTVAQLGDKKNIDKVKEYMKGTKKSYKGGTAFSEQFQTLIDGIDYKTPPIQAEDPLNQDMKLDTKFGDVIGAAGTIGAGLAPLLNTLRARSTDTPNVNTFKNYGQDALATIADAQGLSEQIRTNETTDLNISRNANIRRGRNSSSSVNTSRAVDIATTEAADKMQRQIDNRATQTEMALLDKKANQENLIDQTVMGGEQQRDTNDRMDKGAFETARGQDLASLFTAVQRIGQMSNESEKQKMLFELSKQLSKWGLMANTKGEIVNKGDKTPLTKTAT